MDRVQAGRVGALAGGGLISRTSPQQRASELAALSRPQRGRSQWSSGEVRFKGTRHRANAPTCFLLGLHSSHINVSSWRASLACCVDALSSSPAACLTAATPHLYISLWMFSMAIWKP